MKTGYGGRRAVRLVAMAVAGAVAYAAIKLPSLTMTRGFGQGLENLMAALRQA
jgi:hypothetical protein